MAAKALLIRIIAMLILFCLPVSLHAEQKCTRKSLQSKVNQYLEALKIAAPFSMDLSPQPKYIENGKETSFEQGIWKKALTIDFNRSLLDVETCQTFTEIVHTSSSHPYVIGTRLKIENDKIAEVETLVTDKDDWLFNAENYLKYSSQEKWDILPSDQRSSRQTLIDAANAYFDVFSDRTAASKVPWNVPCARLEGGAYTNPNGDPKASCTGGPPLEGTLKITNRRFIVDPDMGTVVGLVEFGEKDGWPDSHIFRLENGKVRFVHTLTVCPNGCNLPAPKK
jgi:hypothetical protein